jgi:hypothetical protein
VKEVAIPPPRRASPPTGSGTPPRPGSSATSATASPAPTPDTPTPPDRHHPLHQATLQEVATALAAMTGQPHHLANPCPDPASLPLHKRGGPPRAGRVGVSDLTETQRSAHCGAMKSPGFPGIPVVHVFESRTLLYPTAIWSARARGR